MFLTTLCYIEKDGCYLMLHRNKKEHDVNEGKWIGVGGKFEADESPDECLLREVFEETGLYLTEYTFRGIVTFISEGWESEYMFLYTAGAFEGELRGTDAAGEGELAWIRKDKILDLNLWPGDRIFHRLIFEDHPVFSLKLSYIGNDLKEAVLDGAPLI